MVMQARFTDYQSAMCSLTWNDVINAADFQGWAVQWLSYLKNGGDRPPHKPPTA